MSQHYHATIYDQAVDQNARFCWANKQKSQVAYHLQHNGLPLPNFYGGGMGYGFGMNCGGMVYGGANCCNMAPVAAVGQFCPPVLATVAIVGDPVKPDVWTEYCDEASGNKYYHNPAKGEATWDKPEDFDKNKGEGKPKPPDKPKEKKKTKYGSTRSCTWI